MISSGILHELKAEFSKHVKNLQDEITQRMRALDVDISLVEDNWSRLDYAKKDGGGGITRAFEGDLFENAGVNTSEISGKINPEFAKKLQGSSDELWASGISLIIHPFSPKIPTVHMNFRMINQGDKVWFGGGADLTPFYPYEEDFSHFHDVWRRACKPYGNFKKMKETCDKYFVNPHRDGK